MAVNNQETKLINALVEPFIHQQHSANRACSCGLTERGVVLTMIDETKTLRRIEVKMLTPSEPDPD